MTLSTLTRHASESLESLLAASAAGDASEPFFNEEVTSTFGFPLTVAPSFAVFVLDFSLPDEEPEKMVGEETDTNSPMKGRMTHEQMTDEDTRRRDRQTERQTDRQKDTDRHTLTQTGP